MDKTQVLAVIAYLLIAWFGLGLFAYLFERWMDRREKKELKRIVEVLKQHGADTDGPT